MPNYPENINPSDFMDDEMYMSLYLSVLYWGMVSQNPNTTPTKIGIVLNTANMFRSYLENGQ